MSLCSSSYYVQFKDPDGEVRMKIIESRNCSSAVEIAKRDHDAVTILKSGKSINKKSEYQRMFGL